VPAGSYPANKIWDRVGYFDVIFIFIIFSLTFAHFPVGQTAGPTATEFVGSGCVFRFS